MKFTIKTIGCKVNTYESNKLKDELIKIGFEYIDVEDKERYGNLDFYIVNTCSVTSIADKKSRQMLHLAKKYNDRVKVIAIGCLVDSLKVKSQNNDSESLETKALLDGVDYFLLNDEKDKLPELLLSISGNNDNNYHALDNVPLEREDNFNERIRAFIKIEDGCEEYCAYCLIPYLRGKVRSRDENEILNEIECKIKLGVKEVVLTGIHLSSYGLDKESLHYEKNGAIEIARIKLISLISRIAELKVGDTEKEILRIRLGSLEPRIIDDSFLKALTENKSINDKFCFNFCLSLQSGSDKTLKRMNRHYDTRDFECACNLIREYVPYATITTDIIVGFPGETCEDFEDSLSFVKRMKFYNPNIFPYSERSGTRAALFNDKVSKNEKHKRALRMIKECELISKRVEEEVRGEKAKVFGDNVNDDILIEEVIEENGIKYGLGYTKEYIKKKVQI